MGPSVIFENSPPSPRGVDALPHAPLGLGGSVSPTPLSSSFHLSSFAIRWTVPVPMPSDLATFGRRPAAGVARSSTFTTVIAYRPGRLTPTWRRKAVATALPLRMRSDDKLSANRVSAAEKKMALRKSGTKHHPQSAECDDEPRQECAEHHVADHVACHIRR